MKKLFNVKYFVAILLLIFIGDDFLFLAPYVKGHFTKDTSEYFSKSSSEDEVISAVVKASMDIKESQMIQQEYRGLKDDILFLFRPKRNSEKYNNYYMAYNLVGLSYFALHTNNQEVVDNLKGKAESWIGKDGKLTYEIKRIDQCPIGIMYLNLYKITNDNRYKAIAEQLFAFLKERRIDGNLIPYNNNVNNISDAVGMYVPFLMEYSSVTADSLAQRIAIDNMEHFKEYGVDAATHIPFHGYNIKTGVKLGSCNWGRGIGWYLLAMAYCPVTNDSILQENIEKLPYTQFPLSSDNFDSSTALMFEIYKQSTIPGRKLSLDFIKPHVHTNGLVSDCSGDTYAPNDYSHLFGNNELCNGLLLMLYTKFNN